MSQQREALAFAGRRCDEELQLAETMGAAENVMDAFAAWSGFMKEASAQYAAHVSKLAELASTSTLNAVRMVQQETLTPAAAAAAAPAPASTPSQRQAA